MLKEKVSLNSLSIPFEQDKVSDKAKRIPAHTLLSELDLSSLTLNQDIVLIDEAGNPAGIIPIAILIRTIFQEWKNLTKVYQTFLRTVDDAITVVDAAGKVIAWNPKAEELYETSAEKIIGAQITEFFKKESVVLMSTLNEGKGVFQQYNQPKEGVHVLINTMPIMDGDQVIGGISVERNITEIVRLNDELITTTAYIQDLENQIEIEDTFYKIKGRSRAIKDAITLARKVAQTDATVMITGESGVGKELFAQAIHKASTRSEGPFVAINCGAIPAALFESELFGYEKGAFTGAVKEGKRGKIDAAKNGTLFLDEIGELPLELQVKLLRVLQEKQYYRVGGIQPIPVDVRIVSATNRDLEKLIKDGQFREDLYYRLNVVSIPIPPLRERIEDLPELVQLFLQESALKYKKPIPDIDPEVMVTFMHSSWSGNIRQLKNTIERLLILADDNRITSAQLPNDLVRREYQTPLQERDNVPADERSKLIQALKKTYGNKMAAAKLLGISRVTLYNKLKKYGLQESYK